MDRSILRNDILTKGAILGGVMLTSRVIETSMISYGGNIGWMLFLLLEWIVMAVVYVILINSFTRGYARKQLASQQGFQHFSYGNGLSYAILISMLAGVIVAIGSYIVIHGIIGYDNYIDTYSETLKSAIVQLQQLEPHVDASLTDLIELNKQELSRIETSTEPTIIDTIVVDVWGYLISGVLVGAIVAIFTRRKPQIIENNEEQEK